MRAALANLHQARRARGKLVDAHRGRLADSLPGWPFLMPFVGYLGAWVLGIGDMVWPIAALAAVIALQGVRGLRMPPLGFVWLLFLVWIVASLAMVDTSGRMVGAIYRLIMIWAAGALGFYVYHARRALTTRAVLTSMTVFLACTTIGGYVAMAAPLLVFKTPMAYLLPDALLNNELVREMAIRRTTQWNPDTWVVQEPRPSAPFLYSNTWGNVYSFALPLALAHLRLEWALRSRWRWIVLLVCLSSVVPAVATLNRGMFVGLGIVAAWVGFQYLRVGKWLPVLTGLFVALLGFVAWMLSPASDSLLARVETTNSTEDRFTLYVMTLAEVAKSPLFGYGAPRPSADGWLPAMGTQGHFWTVVFSYGFVGLALFLGFFVWAFGKAINRFDLLGAILGGLMLATLIESLFYGLMTGMMVALPMAAMILRRDRIEVDQHQPIPARAGRGRIERRSRRASSRVHRRRIRRPVSRPARSA